MKKIKNKFIIIIILLIIGIIWIEKYNNSSINRNSYILLVEWNATLNWNNLIIDEKKIVQKDDSVKTLWKDSLAILKWWDWSITRIWWNSDILINESNIDNNLVNIQIDFSLNKWKTWSDVISFIWDKSYFKQKFADSTASVRWTIFEVNLDNNYIYVNKHEVNLTKEDWTTKVIKEWKPFNFINNIFIDLRILKDKAWRELNNNLDEIFFDDLKIILEGFSEWDFKKLTLKNISKLASNEKEELYNTILSEYQKFNFVSTKNKILYKKKIELKKTLIQLASDNNKKKLLITTLYDFKDLTNSKQIEGLKETFNIISSNIRYLDFSNINEYLNTNILKSLKIPDSLKKQFKSDFNKLKDNIINNEVNDTIIYELWENFDRTKNSFINLKDVIENLVK